MSRARVVVSRRPPLAPDRCYAVGMWTLALIACRPADPEPPPPPPPAPIVDTSAPVPTGATGDTGSGPFLTLPDATGDTGVDGCDDLPTRPLDLQELSPYLGSEEFAFDADGYLVNVSDTYDAVMRTLKGGSAELIAPYDAVEIAGVRFLADGDLVVADEWEGAVVRITPDGSRSIYAAGLVSPNSLAVRGDGDVFVGGYGEIVRIEPNGQVVRIFELANRDFDGLVFSPDEQTLWLNHDDGGTVGVLDLDDDGDVVSFTSVANLSGALNGAAMDRCGNYYVISIAGTLWRVSRDGSTQRLVELNGASSTSAVRFGSGVGGWERDHVYVMDRGLESLWEVDVGVDRAPLVNIP